MSRSSAELDGYGPAAVFVDTHFLVARLLPRDTWHGSAKQAEDRLPDAVTLVTTREVITEFLSYMAGLGAYFQRQALEVARRVLADRDLYRVMPQRDITFQQALDLYEQRPDKGYSLVDCISMVAMRSEGIPEIVTHDHHFEQEGFRILIKRPVESE